MLTRSNGTEWKSQKNYKDYPQDNWISYDKIANWIIEQGYIPNTTIEKIVEKISNVLDDYEIFNPYTAEFQEEKLLKYINETGGIGKLDIPPNKYNENIEYLVDYIILLMKQIHDNKPSEAYYLAIKENMLKQYKMI